MKFMIILLTVVSLYDCKLLHRNKKYKNWNSKLKKVDHP